MNESEAQTYVDTLLDTVPDGPAPIAGLVAAGARARRRRTRRTVLGAAVAVVLVAVGGTAMTGRPADPVDPTAPNTPSSVAPSSPPAPTTTPRLAVAPPYGMSYVGVGRLVVALDDASWLNQQCLVRDTSLLTTQDLPCNNRSGYQPNEVSFWSIDSEKGRQVQGLTLETRTINGLEVQVDNGGGICQTTPNGQCFVDVIVPSESVVVSIATNAANGIDDILDSLQLLHEDLTTVPSVGDLEPYDAVAARLDDLGLVPEPAEPRQTYVVDLDPRPGTAVATGSPVRITTTDREG